MIAVSRRLVVFAALFSLVAIDQTVIQAKAAYGKGKSSSSRQHKTAPAAQQEAQPPQPAPIPELSPEELPPQPPQVAYANGRLTVEAQNATLSDICEAIGKQTGAQIDTPPDQTERFVVHLSGTPREVLSSLLNGSQIGYIILASDDDPSVVRKVILTKLEPVTATTHPVPVSPQTAAIMNRRGAFARAMAAQQGNPDDQESTESTNANSLNPPPPDPASLQVTPVASGSDPQPLSAPGQFMQELYRLRQQQQQQQNQPAQTNQNPQQ
jgi:hypothetical protein